MNNKSFFVTESGKLTLACVVSLLAFPVIVIGLNTSQLIVAYIGLAMVVLSMAVAPILHLTKKNKK